MKSKVLALLLALGYLFVGCASDMISDQTQRLEEVADPSVRIDIRGASVLPPQEKAWKIVQKNDNQLSLIKGIPQSDSTYSAIVMINELPDIESEEQFSEISKKFLAVYDTERFTIKKEEGEISYSRETYCWRYHLIAEDRGAKTRTGEKVMLLEVIGYICQHPKDRKKGINFGYSHRYYPGDEDTEIKNKANEFLDNVTFTDFISESVISKAESNAKPYYNRGLAYLRKSQYDEGIIELTKAIELNPRYARAYYDRGTAYGKKGQYDHAISDFTKAIELNPKHLRAYINRGYVYKLKGHYDQAISDYSKAIEINPKNPQAYNNKAWILATCVDARYRDGERAVELSQNAVELSPTPGHLDTLAAAYAEAGKFEDAITTQEKVIDLMQKEGKPKNQIDQCKKHLKSYKAHKPWRESRPDKLKGNK